MHSNVCVKADTARDTAKEQSSAPVHLRRAQPSEFLLARTVIWMHRLPSGVQPHVLSQQYARIANLLCLVWHDAAACRQCFTDLLVDSRGGRKGFPQDVHRELVALQEYYCTRVAPSAEDAKSCYLIRSLWDGPDRSDRGFAHVEPLIALLVLAILTAITPV